ncbi:hypothetical protein Tco_0949941 [Tanacetum coccineum]
MAVPLSPTYVSGPMELEHHILVYIPKPVYPEYHMPSDDDIQIEDQPYVADASPSALSPGYIVKSDPKEDPKEDSEEDTIDYAADADNDKEDEEDEEHLALVVALSVVDPIFFVEETEPFETNESAATPPPPPPAYQVARIFALPTPPPSLLTPLLSPLPQIPSPPTHHPLPLPAPSTSHKADIPEADCRLGKRPREWRSFQPRHQDAKMVVIPLRDERLKCIHQEWQHQDADDARLTGHIMRIQALEAGARIDTLEDTGYRGQALIDQGVVDALVACDADRSRNGEDNQDSGTGVRRQAPLAHECTYLDFMKCKPLYFKGTEGVIELTQWFERMETVFCIRNCTVENQIKFVTCTLL